MLAEARSSRAALVELYRKGFSTEAERLTRLITEVKRLSQRSGLVPKSISYPEETLEEYGLVRMSLVFGVQGTYPQLRMLVNLLERSDLFLVLERVGLGGSQESTLNISLEISTFFASDPDALERRARARTGAAAPQGAARSRSSDRDAHGKNRARRRSSRVVRTLRGREKALLGLLLTVGPGAGCARAVAARSPAAGPRLAAVAGASGARREAEGVKLAKVLKLDLDALAAGSDEIEIGRDPFRFAAPPPPPPPPPRPAAAPAAASAAADGPAAAARRRHLPRQLRAARAPHRGVLGRQDDLQRAAW